MDYFLERVGRAFSFIWAAMAMAFRDKDIFLPSLMSMFANGLYFIAIIALLSATGTLWLTGISQSDIDAIKNVGKTLGQTTDALQGRIAEVQKEAVEKERLAAEAAARGETIGPEDTAQSAKAPQAGTADDGPADKRTRKYLQTAFYIVAGFGGFLITYFFAAMTISLIYAHLMGRDARIGEAFAVVTKRIGGIATVAVASVVVDLVAGLFKKKSGRDSLVSAAIVEVWEVALALMLPAMVIEDLSAWNAMKRAKDIVAKNLLIVAVGEIAVGLVGGIILFLAFVGGFIIIFAGFAFWHTPIYVPVGLGGGLIILVMTFVSYVRVAYYTCLYINAMETARVGRRVLPVGPLAAAMG